MAAFVHNGMTKKGLSLLARGIAGEEIKFTKIVLGSGYMEDGWETAEMETLVNPVVSLPISAIRAIDQGERPSGCVLLTGIFHPTQLEVDFYYRELGVFATDPVTGEEILYCYGNAGDEAEHIFKNGSNSLIEKVIDVLVMVGAAAHVSAYIPPNACVTRDEFDLLLKRVLKIETDLTGVWKAIRAAFERICDLEENWKKLADRLDETDEKVDAVLDLLQNSFVDYPFTLSFGSISRVKIISGVWNRAEKRVEC